MNLSANPRILKEIRLADSLQYDIHFLGFHLGNWSDELDKDIRKKIPTLRCTYMDATRKNYFKWLRQSLAERLNRIIWKVSKNNLFLATTASTKRTFSLLNFIKDIKKGDFALVVGHTLGAFYPAALAAKKAGCPYACDIEDYHPGELIEQGGANEFARREFVMKEVLPGARYISASSDLIAQHTKKLCRLNDDKIIPVLNYFSVTEFRTPVIVSGKKIKLIWFSQYISAGRGLETILSNWDQLAADFDLTLIGNTDPKFLEQIPKGIQIEDPLPQTELHAKLRDYDVGLALDLSTRDLNRDLALTNKILAYYQAGLYILATNTAAQRDFILQHPGIGEIFLQNDPASFLSVARNIQNQIESIRLESLARYQKAGTNSWERESDKLKRNWELLLN
jgi:glycosyltransferase involved in cell wall biosynthesis